MEHFIKNELKKLSVACDIFSMEMEFTAIFSECTNEIMIKCKPLAVFCEIWGWYSCGTEDGVWNYYKNCSKDLVKSTASSLEFYGCEQLSKAYLRGAEVFLPLFESGDDSEKNMEFSDKLDSYITEYREEICNTMKKYLLENRSAVCETFGDTEHIGNSYPIPFPDDGIDIFEMLGNINISPNERALLEKVNRMINQKYAKNYKC